MLNDDDPMALLAEKLFLGRAEINKNYRGHARKARLMINDLTYGLALIEGGLGVEEVRANWRRHIDRMWLGRRARDTRPREHILLTLDVAARNYEEPRVAGTLEDAERAVPDVLPHRRERSQALPPHGTPRARRSGAGRNRFPREHRS